MEPCRLGEGLRSVESGIGGLLAARACCGRPSGKEKLKERGEGALFFLFSNRSAGAGSPAFRDRLAVSISSTLNFRRAGLDVLVWLFDSDIGERDGGVGDAFLRLLLEVVSTGSTAKRRLVGALDGTELSEEAMEDCCEKSLPSGLRFDLVEVSMGSTLNLLGVFAGAKD